MRIAHVTGSILAKRSGITGVLINLPMEQNKIDGIESRVLLVDSSFEGERPNHIIDVKLFKLEEYLKEYKPDIIILHDFYVPIYRKVTHIFRKLKIPYFLEPHGAFGKYAMKKSHLKKVVANNTYFRSTIRKASGIIFTTDHEVVDSNYHNKIETIIPNGVQNSVVDRSIALPKRDINNPMLYFMGRFRIFHKGLDYLFDALDILNEKKANVNMRIYGTSMPDEIAYVEGRVNALTNLNVTYEGTVYGSDRDLALNDCSILVLTSRYEGSPLAVLDAFSYGNPVVVTPGTNVSKEIVENKLGWETALNPKAIADTILKAIEEYKAHGKEYIERTRKYVLDNFTWEKMGKKSVEEYEKLLKRLEK